MAEVKERGLTEYKARDGQVISLSFDQVRKYLVQGNSQAVSENELVYFLSVCKSRKLNPLKRDAYIIKYGKDPAAIITSIDYFRSRARAQADCTGWRKGVIVKKDDGTLRDTQGLVLEDEEIVGGWFEAQPTGWTEVFRLEVNLAGYVKKRSDGSVTRFWNKDNQPTMIAKVAESQGLRTLWPDEFQGLYSADEIQPQEVTVDMARNDTGEYSAQELGEKLQETAKKPPPAAKKIEELPEKKPEKPKKQTGLEIWEKDFKLLRSGYEEKVLENLHLFEENQFLASEGRKKWVRLVPDKPWPLDPPKEEDPPQDDPPPFTDEDDPGPTALKPEFVDPAANEGVEKEEKPQKDEEMPLFNDKGELNEPPAEEKTDEETYLTCPKTNFRVNSKACEATCKVKDNCPEFEKFKLDKEEKENPF